MASQLRQERNVPPLKGAGLNKTEFASINIWSLRDYGNFQHRIASRVVDSIQSAVAAALWRRTATEEVFDVRQSERSIARLFLSQCLSLFPTCRAAFQPGDAC